MEQITVNNKTKASKRLDLHGLRGLAVLLVVIYHLFVGRVSGGVDVFLFLSAYFLTAGFVRALKRGRPVKPFNYWARAFKRLLPPAFTVILLSYLAVYLLLGPSTHLLHLRDALAASLQLENWWLILQGVDYYAVDRSVSSPFQHFWSLSLQSQVFVLWPLLFALAGLVIKLLARFSLTGSKVVVNTVFTLFLLVFVFSFAWSLYSTNTQQEIAYFDTAARAWEFALGTLVAILVPPTASADTNAGARAAALKDSAAGVSDSFFGRNKSAVLHAVSLLAVGVLVSIGAFIDVRGAFPGWAALLPLAAATAVIICGRNIILESRIFQFFGDISYALYLVHWPILVILAARLEVLSLSFLKATAVLLVSIVAAVVLTKAVDEPFRHLQAKTRRKTAWLSWAVVSSWFVGTVAVLTLVHQAMAVNAQKIAKEQASSQSLKNPGANIFVKDFVRDLALEEKSPTVPLRHTVYDDWWGLSGHCNDVPAQLSAIEWLCITGEDEASSKKTVLYWGNSRLEQLVPGLDLLFADAGWQRKAVLVGGCAPGFNVEDACLEITAAALEYALLTKPDVVVLQTTFVPSAVDLETASEETFGYIGALQEAGIQVIGFRDHARLFSAPIDCLDSAGPAECSVNVSEQFAEHRPDGHLFVADGIFALDVNEYLCPEYVCQPVIGNRYVFLDESHITKTYSLSLKELIRLQLAQQRFKFF